MTVETMVEPRRQLPIFGRYDVIVVGGGIAGAAAAVAAAREGARTCLLEKEYSLGGLATLGNVIIYLPLCDGCGNQVIGGIGEELLKLSVREVPGPVPDMRVSGVPECWAGHGRTEDRATHRYRVGYNPVSFMMELERWLLRNKVDLWYDTRFCNVIRRRRRIEAVIVENKSGRGALQCSAVVDASGDADVCACAGEPTESLNTNVRCGWYYYLENDRVKLHCFSKHFNPDGTTKRVSGTTHAGDRGKDVTEHVIMSRRLMRAEMAARAKANGSDVAPMLIPTIPSFRMTRRLRAAVELSMADCHRWFEDCVGMTGDWRARGPVMYLPLRALIACQTANLITAGRCISSRDRAWDMTRVIPTCAVTGQGAGVAAAQLAKGSAASFSEINVQELQQRLVDAGVLIDRRFVH